ncbi:MgtC/SapB family protein [Thalassorhabdus alkalitolerans]|uniref:MgtC/SapB family protein n=1 Tax=Thalassorhabdus alkalitolerans TaxID=2282697 RepID=A0ABW0YTS5_9BACI
MEAEWLNNDYVVMSLRLLFAASLAGLVGLEREQKHRNAGFRTHLLVGVGSALVMLLALFGFQPYMEENPELVTFDPSRLASYVISGIGFLGAGTIIVQGASVRGLTTAASIWVVAGIGLAAGSGMYFAALLTTGIVIISLRYLSKVDRFFKKPSQFEVIYLQANRKENKLSQVIYSLEVLDVEINKINMEEVTGDETALLAYKIEIERKKEVHQAHVYEAIQECDGIHELRIEKA